MAAAVVLDDNNPVAGLADSKKLTAARHEVLAEQIRKHALVVDGNRCPDIACPVTAVIKGDARVAEISAASILAKVTRDAQMLDLHQCFP